VPEEQLVELVVCVVAEVVQAARMARSAVALARRGRSEERMSMRPPVRRVPV
jgi:hypothetical protein